MNFRLALFVLIVFLLLAGFHLFIYAQNISLKYQLTDLKVKLSELNSQNQLMGSQLSNGENLGYIEKTAKEKLGMFYPPRITYIIGDKILSPVSSETKAAVPKPR